jgi:predicted Fe-Mo cluster-binding NifX family protein
MNICIPTRNDRRLEAEVSEHFGRAPFYTIVDLETDRLEVVANSGSPHGQHSCHHVDWMADRGVDAVICQGVGRRALVTLREAGISVYGPVEGTVADIVRALRAGEVDGLSAEQACAGHGHHESGRTGCGRSSPEEG